MAHTPIGKKLDYPHCTSCQLITDYDRGEIFCSDCGLVLIDRLEDQGKEWRSFIDISSDRSRVGQATSSSLGNVRLFT
ncbi:MAG: transcription initiation factor IIB, partial [Thaumarchaeota archaeon]|nr:transcription initiation factor IIB [Nitrososphaerota archaeon]